MKRIFAILAFAVSAAFPWLKRLPEVATPRTTSSPLRPILTKANFEGMRPSIRVLKPTSEITLNAADIDFHEVTITSGGARKG
jgi:hypothetical protein